MINPTISNYSKKNVKANTINLYCWLSFCLVVLSFTVSSHPLRFMAGSRPALLSRPRLTISKARSLFMKNPPKQSRLSR